MNKLWASAVAQKSFAFSSEQTAKWQNYGHEIGEDKVQTEWPALVHRRRQARWRQSCRDWKEEESCKEEAQDRSQSLISTVGSNSCELEIQKYKAAVFRVTKKCTYFSNFSSLCADCRSSQQTAPALWSGPDLHISRLGLLSSHLSALATTTVVITSLPPSLPSST